jgi:hypothetical protein
MKKVLFSLFIICLIITNGCKKNNLNDDSLEVLKKDLNNLAMGEIELQDQIIPCNEMNPYDQWGESISIGINKVIQEKAKGITNSGEFLNALIKNLSKEYQRIDTIGVNVNRVNVIFQEFISLYINSGSIEAIQKSRGMENLIVETPSLTNLDKAFLLKAVSILRHISYLSISINSKGIAPGSFEACWIGKLKELENSGFFKKLTCIADWPMCFGVMLADCVLEEIKDHIF